MTNPAPPRAPSADLSTFDRRRRDALTVTGEQRIAQRVELAFAPLHKAAFGVAAGIVFGGLLAAVTLLTLVIDEGHVVPLALLAQYFYGYSVTPVGVLVGAAWGFAVGFVAGWFVAFARNVVMALWVLYFRARADWRRTNDFLDYV